MEAASHPAVAGIARYLNRRAQSKRSRGPQVLLQMPLKSPFNEDLYFAQIAGRSSVLRRGLASLSPLTWRGFPKIGTHHNTILPIKLGLFKIDHQRGSTFGEDRPKHRELGH